MSNPNNNSNDTGALPKTYYWLPLVAAFIYVLLVVHSADFVKGHYGPFRTVGEFGDTFGALNTIFSGMAFIGVLSTLRIQQRQLKIQQEEIKENQDQIAQQKEELYLQRFETKLSKAFEIRMAFLSSLHISIQEHGMPREYRGPSVYFGLVRSFSSQFKLLQEVDHRDESVETAQIALSKMGDNQGNDLLATYYELMFSELQTIHKANLDEKTKKFHAATVINSIPIFALMLMYYFSLRGDADSARGELLNHYQVFWKLNSSLLLHPSHTHAKRPLR